MGVGTVISKALRTMGVQSHVMSTCPHPFGFENDSIMPRHRFLGRVPVARELLRKHDWAQYFEYDILHSHDNSSIPSFMRNHWHNRFIQHYHDPQTDRSLYSELSVVSFVSVPTILQVIPDAQWIPLPSDTQLFSPMKRNEHEGVRVGFCDQQLDPKKQQFIPRREIIAATNRHHVSVYPLSTIIPHQAMANYYGQIDIWVDRIGLGFYGFSAVEAAAMEIPVITQIGREEQKWIPDCPFINAKREEVTDAIGYLASSQEARRSIGQASRQFILRTHDAKVVAERCLNHYEKLLGRSFHS